MLSAPTRSLPIAGALLLAMLCAYGAASTPGVLPHDIGGWPAAAALAVWLATAAWAAMAARRTPPRWAIALFALWVIALRLAVAAIAAGRLPPGDAAAYPAIARALRDGHGLVFYEPFMAVWTRALYPPVYPLVLAAWTTVCGSSAYALVALSTITDIATAALIVALGRRLGTRRAALAAALLYLAWPANILSAPFAAKEGLIAALTLAVAIGWIDIVRGERMPRAIALTGIATGLLALTQPGLATLSAYVGLAMARWLGPRRLIGAALPAALIAILMMLPWWLRNAQLFGAFVPLTSAGGYSLWIGNNPQATGSWMPPPAALRGLPELAFGHAAGALAHAWIATHPAAFVRLTATKFVRASAIGIATVTRLATSVPYPAPALTAPLFVVAQAAHLLLLGGGALALARRAVPPLLGALLLAGLAQLLLVDVWFEFAERHCMFLIAPLLLAIGCLIERRGPAAPAQAANSSS